MKKNSFKIIGIIAALIILVTAPHLAGGIFAALVFAGVLYGLFIVLVKIFKSVQT